MEESKLDILTTREEQLKILVPYLEEVAKGKKDELLITSRTRVFIDPSEVGGAFLLKED